MREIFKKILMGVLVMIPISIVIYAIYFIFFSKPKIQIIPLPKEGIKREKTTEEILKDLTPREPRPLTEEEKKEIEKILQDLTPKNPRPKTPEEIKAQEELLKNLTPK
jgi:hypothetical protein